MGPYRATVRDQPRRAKSLSPYVPWMWLAAASLFIVGISFRVATTLQSSHSRWGRPELPRDEALAWAASFALVLFLAMAAGVWFSNPWRAHELGDGRLRLTRRGRQVEVALDELQVVDIAPRTGWAATQLRVKLDDDTVVELSIAPSFRHAELIDRLQDRWLACQDSGSA